MKESTRFSIVVDEANGVCVGGMSCLGSPNCCCIIDLQDPSAGNAEEARC